ncbi:MAG: hypothetical protein ACREAE_08620 [Nitrosopumilaceae archaeon]
MSGETECIRLGGMCVDVASFYVELASAIFFAATIGFLIWDTHLQRKSSRLEILDLKYNSYQSLRDNHHDQIRMQIEDDDLLEIFTEHKMPDKYKGLDKIELEKKETKIFSFYLSEFDLYERVFLAKEDPDIEDVNEYEWLTWLMYMEKISHHWLFVHTYNQTRKIFDTKFMNDIRSKIIEQKDASKYIEEEAKKAYFKEYGEELTYPEVVK